MICPTCGGRHGWWVDAAGIRLRQGDPYWLRVGLIVAWRECHDCISGISSCCDTAGAGIAEGGGSRTEPKFSRCFECGLEPYECRCPTPGRAQPEDAS
jgi:hypothetical protein